MDKIGQYVILEKGGTYHFSPNHPSTYVNIVGGVNCVDVITKSSSANTDEILNTLVAGLCDAAYRDEQIDGLDLSAGLYGVATTEWIKNIAAKIHHNNVQIKKLQEELTALGYPVSLK